MDKVDLNIENYNLNEILELFKLDYNFNCDDLKKAKRVVLMTHPDKSKMPKEYFLFYSKAYKMLYYIFEFRNKEEKCNVGNTNYQQYTNEEDKIEHKNLIQQMNKKEEFHSWFNRLFEKHYDRSIFDQEGYGNWFKSQEDMYNKDNKNFTQLTNNLDNIKQQQKSHSLVKKINIEQDVGHNINSSNIYTNDVQNYSSGINMSNNSSMQYNDLKQAFQETLIPVTHEDYNNVKKYNNINEIQIHRKQSSVKPLTEKESYDILREREEKNNEISNKAAYNLLEQTRKNNEQNAMFWGSLKLLGNK
jgi:hypothetical protein